MEHSTIVLLFYFLGAFLRLAEKARIFIYRGSKEGKSAKISLKEWAFEKSVENGASWVGTIGIVWLGGYLYVKQIPGVLGFSIPDLIVAAPVGFMLGFAMEQWAPNLSKKFASKLPFNDKEDA